MEPCKEEEVESVVTKSDTKVVIDEKEKIVVDKKSKSDSEQEITMLFKNCSRFVWWFNYGCK